MSTIELRDINGNEGRVFYFRLLVLIFPLVLIQFSGLKNIAWLCAIGAIALWAFLYVMTGKPYRDGFWILISYLLFIGYQVILTNFRLMGSIVDLAYISVGFVFITLYMIMQGVSRIWFFKLIVFSSTIIGIFIVIFHLTDWYPEDIVFPPYAGVRWVGGFDGPNEFAQFYTLILAIHLGMFLERRMSPVRFFFPIVVLTPLVYFSYSRGALIAFAGVLAMFSILYILKYGARRVLAWSIVAGSAGIYYFQDVVTNFFTVRVQASERGEIVDMAMDLFQHSPIFGNGIGAFQDFDDTGLGTPHSGYLYFLISGGLIAVTLYIVFLGYLIYRSYRYRDYTFLLFIFCFMICELTFNNLPRGRVSLLFWIVLTVTACSWRMLRRRRAERGDAGQSRVDPGASNLTVSGHA